MSAAIFVALGLLKGKFSPLPSILLTGAKYTLRYIGPYAMATGQKMLKFSFIYFGLYLVGTLASSPFRLFNSLLEQAQADIPQLQYILAFVPVGEILLILGAWVLAICAYQGVKIFLRKAGITC